MVNKDTENDNMLEKIMKVENKNGLKKLRSVEVVDNLKDRQKKKKRRRGNDMMACPNIGE